MSHIVGLQEDYRGTGRTTRILQALPRNMRVILLVHNEAMRDHMRAMLRKTRPDLGPLAEVRVVTSAPQLNPLRGFAGNVVPDHAWIEAASPELLQSWNYFAHIMRNRHLPEEKAMQLDSARRLKRRV